MKQGILLLLLLSSVFTQAQTLKEALYGGKLKSQNGTVIHKDDDLSTHIDTTTTVATNEPANTTAVSPAEDSVATAAPVQADAAAVTPAEKQDTVASTADATAPDTAAVATTETAPAPAASTAPKSNNALWKEYMDTIANNLKAEALSSKKVKRGSYYVMVSYAIETDGQVTVGDVFVSPENNYLQQQIKDRLAIDTPRLAPVLNSAGTPRKVTRKASFTLTKE